MIRRMTKSQPEDGVSLWTVLRGRLHGEREHVSWRDCCVATGSSSSRKLRRIRRWPLGKPERGRNDGSVTSSRRLEERLIRVHAAGTRRFPSTVPMTGAASAIGRATGRTTMTVTSPGAAGPTPSVWTRHEFDTLRPAAPPGVTYLQRHLAAASNRPCCRLPVDDGWHERLQQKENRRGVANTPSCEL
jgi:hypothetical protein